MDQTEQEQQLIRRVQAGDVTAYGALVRAYETLAFRAAFLITHDEHEAADAAQDGLVRAYRAIHTFRLGEPFRPWLLKIVTNQALNRVQAQQRRSKMTERYAQALTHDGEDPTPDERIHAREESEALHRAVRQLKAEEQTLIALRYFLELPEAEVAQALGIPQGTVKSRLHRTLAKLRDLIQADYPELERLTLDQ